MIAKEDLDKKILENRNADEILNDDELEKVSGGAPRRMFEPIDTNKFSNILGLTATIPNR